MHCKLYPELDNLIAMESLRTSANKGSNDAYDVHTSNHKTELELSVESRSFVNRVNDQVRISNVAEDEEEHSLIWLMFMSVTMESAVFMGKNYLDTCHSITNTKHVTLKQMFDICKIVSEQDEISGVWSGKLVGKNIHGNICLSLVMKESSIFNARKSTSFRILCCVMG